ncbi:hypothetical protein EX30DRAFT_396092 [Ascodesmis nigricans]|uniref:Uncharacterized protein n=1 Tax=Ascodesmis nigricans TaxID=341454 RepID=A0A4S2MVJ5_9PEZI|nr:hypothetical protein EX30DRAFT_396092 [Ascodesmis nigricans]
MCYWGCDFFTRCSHAPLYLQDFCPQAPKSSDDAARKASQTTSRSHGHAYLGQSSQSSPHSEYRTATSSATRHFDPPGSTEGVDTTRSGHRHGGQQTMEACGQIIYISNKDIDDWCPDCQAIDFPKTRHGPTTEDLIPVFVEKEEHEEPVQIEPMESKQESEHSRGRHQQRLEQTQQVAFAQFSQSQYHNLQQFDHPMAAQQALYGYNLGMLQPQDADSGHYGNREWMAQIMGLNKLARYHSAQQDPEDSKPSVGIPLRDREYQVHGGEVSYSQEPFRPLSVNLRSLLPLRHQQEVPPIRQYQSILPQPAPKPRNTLHQRQYSGIIPSPSLSQRTPMVNPLPSNFFSSEKPPQYQNTGKHRNRYQPKQNHQQYRHRPQYQHQRTGSNASSNYSSVPVASTSRSISVSTGPEPFKNTITPGSSIPIFAPRAIPPPITVSQLYMQAGASRRTLDLELAKARDREVLRQREREREMEIEAEKQKQEDLARAMAEQQKERLMVMEYYRRLGYGWDVVMRGGEDGGVQEGATRRLEMRNGVWGVWE